MSAFSLGSSFVLIFFEDFLQDVVVVLANHVLHFVHPVVTNFYRVPVEDFV